MNRWKARVTYDSVREGYRVEINTGNGWGLDRFYPCEHDMVSYVIISHLAELQWLGYSLSFKEL